jgi:hypothetical protein
MPERKRRPRDPNQLAYQTVQEGTIQAEQPAERPDTRNPAAVERASTGGHARAAALLPARRRAIAKAAVAARWRKE